MFLFQQQKTPYELVFGSKKAMMLSSLWTDSDFIFRETYNLITCINGNPSKERYLVYTIGKHNGTVAWHSSRSEWIMAVS
jgi:hypothetical protein